MLLYKNFKSLRMFWGRSSALLRNLLPSFSIMMGLARDTLIFLLKRQNWRKLQLWFFKMVRIHIIRRIYTTDSECGWGFLWDVCTIDCNQFFWLHQHWSEVHNVLHLLWDQDESSFHSFHVYEGVSQGD